jgi:hypothetical protein
VSTATARPLVLLVAAVLLSSCSFFQRPPPLPRHAAVEPADTEKEFVGLVQGAVVIYFPREAAALTSRAEPAWKLLAALDSTGGAFAIGADWNPNERARRHYLDEAAKSGAEIMALDEADQIVAEKIVAYLREHRNDKVLVFIRRERIGLGQGIPYLVAQETKARQLILNPRKSSSPNARLLAGN